MGKRVEERELGKMYREREWSKRFRQNKLIIVNAAI